MRASASTALSLLTQAYVMVPGLLLLTNSLYQQVPSADTNGPVA